MTARPPPDMPTSRLLAARPAEEVDQLRPHPELVAMPSSMIVHDPAR